MKYLVVMLVVGLGLWLLRGRLRGGRSADADLPHEGGKGGKSGKSSKVPASPTVMVECAHCGLHLASADALPEGSRLYCSDAHRRLGPGPAP